MLWLKQANCWLWAVQGLQLDIKAINMSAFKAGRLSLILNRVIPMSFSKMVFTAALLSSGIIGECEDSRWKGRQRW